MSEFDPMDAGELQRVEGPCDDPMGPIPHWQQEELDRRRARFQANPDRGLSWPEVRSRVRRGHKGASG